MLIGAWLHLLDQILIMEIFFFFFFWEKKKRTCVWRSLSHAPRYSWVSPWVPPAQIGARKLRTHTHPSLYWFLGLLENYGICLLMLDCSCLIINIRFNAILVKLTFTFVTLATILCTTTASLSIHHFYSI